MDNLKVFNYNNREVRTVVVNGEPWWILKDVCAILGIANTTDVAKRLDDDEVTRFNLGGLSGENNIVNESGLYNVILRSDKPEAKQFKRWVVHEVLPTIRKTGGYVANDDLFIGTYLPFADDTTKQMFRMFLNNTRELNQKIEQDKPKVLFADAVAASDTSILVGDLAKLIKQNGVNIGQNRLFCKLRAEGYLISGGARHNMPTQRAMDLKLFEICERAVTNPDGSVHITRTPKVTGKGQTYFVKRYLAS